MPKGNKDMRTSQMADCIQVSDNLYVRPICREDTGNVVRWRNNPRVVNNFLYREPITIEIHNHWLDTKVASGEVVQFIIEEHSTGNEVENHNSRPVGSIYFRDVDNVNHTAEYGIFIGEDDAIGRGIGNEVASWAVEYAREQMGLKTLILRVLEDNTSAIRSYQKAGFEVYEKQEDYIDGRALLLMKAQLK